MSKRFSIFEVTDYTCDKVLDNGELLTIEEVVHLLNKMDETIEKQRNIIKKQDLHRISMGNIITAIQKWGVKAPCFKENGEFDEDFYPPE